MVLAVRVDSLVFQVLVVSLDLVEPLATQEILAIRASPDLAEHQGSVATQVYLGSLASAVIQVSQVSVERQGIQVLAVHLATQEQQEQASLVTQVSLDLAVHLVTQDPLVLREHLVTQVSLDSVVSLVIQVLPA